ncbi:hypothetical protein [Arthrobacter sp. ISL-28]|uniref:hypothetical protein n=1 Tax=Arthrobacter sp. ISL-28 TaxID=2819108 RepID=UPI002035F66C|nr:hypothetical protein [Arthrobacter sp. ISL-28]
MPTASNVRAERFWPAVPERIWDSIREEFTLPTTADLEAYFQALGDPEAMRRAVRVFIGEGTFCPGFQLRDGHFNAPVLRLCGPDQAGPQHSRPGGHRHGVGSAGERVSVPD